MIDQTEPLTYEIRLKESLSDDWQGWFDDMRLTIQADGSTLLIGPIIDQAALYGTLIKIAALGLTLVSVNQAVKDQGDGACE